MKKLLIIFVMTILALIIPQQLTFAMDIVPTKVEVTNMNVIGLYQVSDDVVIYKEPDDSSMILYRVRWNSEEFFPQSIGAENFFEVFIPKRSLALVNVVDMTDDWIEIIYDKASGKTGWIKLDDPYKFLTWINFYSSYGKKYGLVMLKGNPETCKDIKASTEDKTKTISTINCPKKIMLNSIRGNWALVSVLDLDKVPKTGFIRWRSDNGVRYFFPDFLAKP